ncbi:hypothetical protein A5740_04925 [Mycobacterium sp. GA-1841]|uniref:C2 family cysteine protease n=1 Tax=Mycobacterium sp. GA-1841 TaxID=1834154 RepID=UPI00096E77A6|nr:C2 family cysteine protease [Mycobacterium sp. GA-1841]OMC37332.1 hypothetical protein A5740_04925 [Mycobacterium sp. GA-1841]
MTATVSTVQNSRPERLTEAAEHAAQSAARVDRQVVALRTSLSQLGAGWRGDAYGAASAATERRIAEHEKMAGTLHRMESVLAGGGSQLTTTRTNVVTLLEQLKSQGWQVADDGTVSIRPGSTLEQFAKLNPANAIRLQALAADASVRMKTMLAEFDTQDRVLAKAIQAASSDVSGPSDVGGPGDDDGDPAKRKWTDEDLFPHDPTAADVQQDQIGDCYLDSTLGAVANANPQKIKDRIKYDDGTGNFDVTLWDGHEWKHITVTQDDINTNIDKHGASRLDNGDPDAPLWPAVMESAYAKLKAPGANMNDALDTIGKGGQTKDALEAVTGNRGDTLVPADAWRTGEHIDSRIAEALANHQPVTLSTSSDAGPLVHNHAYIVESISGTGNNATVTLRNPWESNPNGGGPLITIPMSVLMGSGTPRWGDHPVDGINIGNM